MQALRLLEWNSDPVLVEVDDPEPGPGQVVVRIGGSGACHSDLHLMHEFGPGLLPWGPPFTLGHENAGWVHALGAGVVGFDVGQPVAVYGSWGCGSCSRCQLGMENYCEDTEHAPVAGGGGGLGLDGGMAEFMLVPAARLLVPLPDGLDPVHAAPLTDAGLTPYHAIRRSWPLLVPSSTAVVIGIGGLGHLAIQILKATTATRVVAVDTRPEARALALDEGADLVLAPDGAAEEIRSFTDRRGSDLVLDFVGSDATLALGAAVVRQMGEVTVIGIAGGSYPFSFFTLPYEAGLRSTYWGSRPELAEVLDLAAQGHVRPVITTCGLDEATGAYRCMSEGVALGRQVIVPNLA